MGNPRIADMLRSIWTTKFNDKKMLFAFTGEKEEELLALKAMIESEKIKSVIDRVYSMAQASAAHSRVETEQRLGSIIISMNNRNTSHER